MTRDRGNRRTGSVDRRTQAVLDKIAENVEQLEIDHTLRRAITDHIFDESRVAMLRAIHSADFIYRLIETSSSIPEHQKAAMRGIADQVIELAQQVPRDAYEDGRRQLEETRAPHRTTDGLDGVLQELQTEWNSVKTELESLFRRFR